MNWKKNITRQWVIAVIYKRRNTKENINFNHSSPVEQPKFEAGEISFKLFLFQKKVDWNADYFKTTSSVFKWKTCGTREALKLMKFKNIESRSMLFCYFILFYFMLLFICVILLYFVQTSQDCDSVRHFRKLDSYFSFIFSSWLMKVL